jgi:hypothetical protein
MGKRIAILQSNYIPWKGYFDLIRIVDEFIIYDEVQYTKNDWRNRNKVKSPTGAQWLTIPILYHFPQKISETVVSSTDWAQKHWKTITLNYSRAPFFKEYKDVFEKFYTSELPAGLSEINRKAMEMINEILGIKTKITSSADYTLSEGRNERLVSICKQAGATEYISGPAAKNYMDESLFAQEGIKVSWMDYSGYREYPQLFPPFEHGVSIIDLIFNTGSEAIDYIAVKETAPYDR